MRTAITCAFGIGLGFAAATMMTRTHATVQQPAAAPAANPDSQYRLGPDSMPQEGVPKGEIKGPYTLPCQVYPGTQHTYWVYVPAQYDPAIPTAVMVYNDGQAFKNETGDLRAQNVMDNLIYRREIPVMLGVFINPGRRPDQPEPTPKDWGDRNTNRPTEYNSLDDKYARVITEELMPALAKEFNISKDPEMHGIGGSSSGALAAFTVAWERPDHFRKVLSNIGSFVNLRGGHVYPEKVLAAEKKPIRVYLCDGRNDNRGLRGAKYDQTRDWFYQNVRLMKALTQKGYDVNYSWGMNSHGQKFGGAIMPDMMRWLWRDGPVSTDPKDTVERSFRQPVAKKNEPDPQARANLSKSLTFHASFDKGLDADFSPGEHACYIQRGKELVLLKPNEDVKLAAGEGRFGGALYFPKKGGTRPSYKDDRVLGYNAKSWSASVSVWLRLNPDKDLEPGYCDPVQIIGDDTKKGYIFCEWSKDETPRYFRYAIRPLFHIWNPDNKQWGDIPFEKRPMVQVDRAPFSREKWTHVVFTLENINDKTKPPVGRLYLDGKLQGAIEKWDLTFDWDPAKVLLVLGANYVGYMDDLAVFNRAITDAEVTQICGLKRGVRELYPPR